MKAKKFLFMTIALLIVCASVGLVACGGGTQKEKVNITGSSSVSPLMQKLASEFEKQNKNIKINITTSDSSTGIANTIAGANDIGMSSRGIKSTEIGITETKIADDGVVMIANPNCELTDLTNEQIYNLYANGVAIDNFAGAISREEGSGTRDAFDGLITNAKGDKLSTLAQLANCIDIQNSTGNVMVEIASNSTKLGYISLGSLNNTVKALTFNGVAATAENIKNKTYKLARPFVIVTKDGKEKSVATQKFIDFILSESGQQIVVNSGYIAL